MSFYAECWPNTRARRVRYNSIDNDDPRIFESETVTVKLGHAVFGNIF